MPKIEESQGRKERRQAGRDIRKKVPRTSWAHWEPAPDRRDPVEILLAQGADRVQDLLPLRHALMLQTPFTFYRGAAAVMAADLAPAPRTGLTVQLAGDAHLANFGGYASPERSFVFDVNDFDETLPGPFEWDLKRLAASFAVAGRARGFSKSVRQDRVRHLVKSYREAMAGFSDMSRMEVYYERMTAERIQQEYGGEANAESRANFQSLLEDAQNNTSQAAMESLTTTVDGQLKLVSKPPKLVPIDELAGAPEVEEIKKIVDETLVKYRRTLEPQKRFLVSGYRVMGVARKVVGVGSVGTRCWVVLLMADQDESDSLVLQFKEATESVLEPYLGRSQEGQHGRRVVDGQRMMQATSDALLGWARVTAPNDGQTRDYYVRQLKDWKESANLDTITRNQMGVYGRLCGWTLARAHARSGDRVALAGYLGGSDTLDQALADYAEAYADQNEQDHAAMQAAADSGRIEVAQLPTSKKKKK